MGIGAMTRLSEICRNDTLRRVHPALVRAVATISTPVLRNMGTIGGNLCLDTRCTYYNQNEEWRQSISYCMKEAGETCWVAPGSPRCWATSASDSGPLLCAMGAKVRLVSSLGERTIPVVDLFEDDGIQYLTRRHDEVLTRVILPAAGTMRATYWKLRRRGSIDFPVLGVGAAVALDASGAVREAAIFLGAVASAPKGARDAAAALVGSPLTEESIAVAAALAREPATPLDNTDFTLAWRKQMVERYVAGALHELAGLPFGTPVPRHGQRPA
jgi:4-hydroxybenzoyl-CoA reductase subunit beta